MVTKKTESSACGNCKCDPCECLKRGSRIPLGGWIRILVAVLLIIGAYIIGVMAGMHRDGKYYNNDGYRNRHTMRMMDDDRKYGMSKKMPTMMMDDMSTMDPMDMSMHDMSTMLEGKTGSGLERAFLEGMIPHHQGAVEMANYLTGNIKPELQKMRDEIINAQTKEIEMMKKWLVDWGYTSTGTTTLSSEDEMMREHCKTMPEMVGCEKYK